MNESNSGNTTKAVSTGIAGFDGILDGGYPRWEDEIAALSVATDNIIPPNHAGRMLPDYEMSPGWSRWHKRRPRDEGDWSPWL
jgi:hypothetical protein